MALIVVALFAHPDDEVLACGATLARHAAAGDRIVTLFLSDGETARQPHYEPGAYREKIEARKHCARRAASILGCDTPRFLDLPDNRLDALPLLEIVKAAGDALSDLAPDIVYTHHAGDLNVDHRIAHQLVLTLFRPLPGRPAPRILAGEVASSTEWGTAATGPSFTPTVFVDASKGLDRKVAALKAYENELPPFPHPRSIDAARAQATLRGVQAGLGAAEAFVLVREIVRD